MGMSRPPFTPDADQQRALRVLSRAASLLKRADADVTRAIVNAKEQGVPIEHIAKALGLAVKTVYNRLARG